MLSMFRCERRVVCASSQVPMTTEPLRDGRGGPAGLFPGYIHALSSTVRLEQLRSVGESLHVSRPADHGDGSVSSASNTVLF